ncbi:phosphatase PAP2 family protein [Streptomyces kaempferi]
MGHARVRLVLPLGSHHHVRRQRRAAGPRAARAGPARRPLALVVGCWSVLVGLSRVYLGVHWFSDVLGGWLFSLCWLSLTVYALARFLPPSWSSISALRPRPDALTTEERRDDPHSRREIPPQSPP